MRGKPGSVPCGGRPAGTSIMDPLTGRRTRAFFETQKDAQKHQDHVNAQPKPRRHAMRWSIPT